MFRILHIIPQLCKGGAERLCLDICNELQKREGVQVRLITFSDENAYPQLTKNIDWQIVPAAIQLSVLHKNQYSIQSLQKAIEEFAPNIIHTHLFEAEIVSRSCCYQKAKWFSHCHDNMKQFKNFSIRTLFNKEFLTNFYEKQYVMHRYKANGGNTFVAISKDTKQYFDRVVPQFETVLLPNAINYQRFYKKREYSLSNIIRLVNVGSYQQKKNQTFLVDVAYELRKRDIDFELSLLGDGELYKDIEQKINDLQLQDRVIQYGNVDNVEEYLWDYGMYVHSATYEPLGLVILEAMAVDTSVFVKHYKIMKMLPLSIPIGGMDMLLISYNAGRHHCMFRLNIFLAWHICFN